MSPAGTAPLLFFWGTMAVPVLTQGTGPHAVRASCRHCGAFLKWLPRVLVKGKEVRPVGGVNRALLVGTIGKYGVEGALQHERCALCQLYPGARRDGHGRPRKGAAHVGPCSRREVLSRAQYRLYQLRHSGCGPRLPQVAPSHPPAPSGGNPQQNMSAPPLPMIQPLR